MSKWINNLGRVIKRKEKDDNGKDQFFIKFERPKDKDGNYRGESPFPLTINEGDVLQMKRKEYDLQGLIDRNLMDEKTVAKICENVKYELSKAPDKEDAGGGKATSSKPAKKTDVDF